MRQHARFKLSALVGALAIYVAPLLAALTVAPSTAEARVTPLNVLLQQMQKPNMLVLLDTSGSMNGVPGTLFTYSSEAGVDCDNGQDCRNWSATNGSCSVSGRSCGADADCSVRYCRVGMGACASNANCPTQGFCSKGGKPCATDPDCVNLQAGGCGGNQDPYCDTNSPCPIRRQCSETNNVCDSTGKACKAGWCQNSKIFCESDRQCGVKKNGDCSQGGTPSGGCATDGQCPISTRCTVSNTVCQSNNDCPLPTAGLCKYSRKACATNNDCRLGEAGQNDGIPEVCEYPRNLCQGSVNVCQPEYNSCQYSAGNTCQEVDNACKPVDNLCIISTRNECLPASTGEVCQQGIKNPGALKMCQTAQSVCNVDADCPTGDTCGQPTSRTVVAKRVLQDMISENYDLMHMGLMTFHQSGYFPYVEELNPTMQKQTVFLNTLQMGSACFDNASGPTTSCSYSGSTYTLRPTNPAQYRIRVNNQKNRFVDAAYCGTVCAVPGEGTGWYTGSYYEGDVPVGTAGVDIKVQTSYVGESVLIGGKQYRYFNPSPDYYNGAAPPPISVADCTAGICSAACGARWDSQLSTFINPTQTQAQARTAALKMNDWLAKAKDGGLLTYGGTPTGCTLQNSGAPRAESSAYHYMESLKNSDPKTCRPNYVLLITDGEANGPGDQSCTNSACSDDNPIGAGCTCRSVLAAYNLRKNLGVRTFVVGFSTDVSLGPAKVINDNIAKAGGTDMNFDGRAPYAYVATNEAELSRYVRDAVLEALRGSYATAPATSSSGVQLANSVSAGNLALDARVDFPSWNGHMLAYDVSKSPPELAWDTNVKMGSRSWWTRRIYLGTRGGEAVKVVVDPQTKEVTNKALIHQLGIGSSPEEAEAIMKFTMSDPESGNTTLLGAMLNSTPIDVGQPGNSPLPGGAEFFSTYKDRPNLTYVGSSDGMLHAFFTKDITIAGANHDGGEEAFAYVPPAMFRTLEKLYVLGGQPKDPRDHVFGLASSPKVKNVCVTNCDSAENAVWKTLLVMTEGHGGSGIFMLDITSPLGPNGFSDPPILPIWHSDNPSLAANFAQSVGKSISVPAFFFNKTAGMDDFRLIFASGYPTDATQSKQGRRMVVADMKSGNILDIDDATASGSCNQEYTMLTDAATEKDFFANNTGGLRAAFAGDTWGQLWRYRNGSMGTLVNYGCDHPLHFAPTVVQLDRDDPDNNPGQTFMVQVTNSALDADTTNLPPSKMVIMKHKADEQGAIGLDNEFDGDGIATLTVGTNELCAVTNLSGGCDQMLPANARPMSTPIGILNADGSGFLVMSTWYAPDLVTCTMGQTWLLMHHVTGNTLTQRQGLKVADEPLTAPVIVGGKIFLVGSEGATNITGSLMASFSTGSASPTANVGAGLFEMLGWMEIR